MNKHWSHLAIVLAVVFTLWLPSENVWAQGIHTDSLLAKSGRQLDTVTFDPSPPIIFPFWALPDVPWMIINEDQSWTLSTGGSPSDNLADDDHAQVVEQSSVSSSLSSENKESLKVAPKSRVSILTKEFGHKLGRLRNIYGITQVQLAQNIARVLVERPELEYALTKEGLAPLSDAGIVNIECGKRANLPRPLVDCIAAGLSYGLSDSDRKAIHHQLFSAADKDQLRGTPPKTNQLICCFLEKISASGLAAIEASIPENIGSLSMEEMLEILSKGIQKEQKKTSLSPYGSYAMAL